MSFGRAAILERPPIIISANWEELQAAAVLTSLRHLDKRTHAHISTHRPGLD